MSCVSCGRLPNKRELEWRKFELLMQTLGKEPTEDKFKVFMNRSKPEE